MNFLVLLGHDNRLDFAPLAEKSYADYAARHGYAFHCAKFLPEVEGYGHPAWQKLPLMQRMIEEDKWDWILWADTDSIVTNEAQDLYSLTGWAYPPNQPDASWMLVSRDWSDGESPWSAGVMLVRSCPQSHAFFSEARKHGEFMNSGCWDQSALHAVCRETPWLAEGLKILPRRILQSVPKETSDGVVEPWQPGDFICHFSGQENRHRRARMERYAKLVVR